MANSSPEVKVSNDWAPDLSILRSQIIKQILIGLAVCAAYILAGKLSLRLASVHPSATPVWPPTGIAIAALLTFGSSFWPAIFAGAFVVNLTTAGSVLSSLGISAGNTLEAVVACYLVTRFANGRRAFERTWDILRFALYAGILSSAVTIFGIFFHARMSGDPWTFLCTPLLVWTAFRFGQRESSAAICLLSV